MEPENSNPNGPDRNYNWFDQLVYDLNISGNQIIPANIDLARPMVDFYMNTPILRDSLGMRAAADAVYDVAHERNSVSAPRTPARPSGNNARTPE